MLKRNLVSNCYLIEKVDDEVIQFQLVVSQKWILKMQEIL